MADPYTAGQTLGSALFGSQRGTYDDQLGRSYKIEQALQDARQARSSAMLGQRMVQAGEVVTPELIAAYRAGDVDATNQLIAAGVRGSKDLNFGVLGDIEGAGYRRDAVQQATLGDWGAANASLMGVANGPQELGAVQGQNLLQNRFLPGGGGISTTEQGRAGIAADAARARASDASAASSYASADSTRQRLGIAQSQFALQRAGKWNPDGSAGGTLGDPAAKATEGERSSAGYLQRMIASGAELDGLQASGYKAANLRDFLTAGEGPFLNSLASDEGQVNRQQQEDWVRAKLRKESGAVIGEEEMDREIKTYFPQPGDSSAALAAKSRSRERAIEQMRISAGRAATLGDRPRVSAPGPGLPDAPGVQRARNPKTGQVLVLRNGQWVPE